MKIKVLHVLASGNFSGAEKIALQIITKTSDTCDSVYYAEEGLISEYLILNDVKFKLCKKLSISNLFFYIKKYKPDVVHAHDFKAGLFCSLIPLKFKLIWQIHQNPKWLFNFNLKNLVFYFSCFRPKKILFVGGWFKSNRFYNRFFAFKSTTPPVLIDSGNISILSSDFSFNELVKSDILFLGRLSIEKGAFTFIKLIEKLKQSYPEICAIIVGDGPEYSSLLVLTKELKLEKNILFMGFKVNPYPFIANTNVVVIPSIYEGFGLVAIESLILGKRLVASNVGGLSENLSSLPHTLCDSFQDFIDNTIYHFNTEIDVDYKIRSKKIVEKFTDELSFSAYYSKLYSS